VSKRRLKRQLNLVQVVMLGTAGTIAAEIFVLTGHAAGIAGPYAVLAILIGGLLSYSVALNYCELATTYPETGGAMTYVREAFGNNLLSFLVGSMDCISSTFYAALSAIGFAYSMQVFFPSLPLIPVALAAIALFTVLSLFGVSLVGNIQIVLGGTLLLVFGVFIFFGFVNPGGFRWETFIASSKILDLQHPLAFLGLMLMTIALTYNAYVGFEVIADDAEEVSNPNRNIPRAILISLTICLVVYTLVSFVTLGVVPIRELAGSGTALTDAIQHFLPGIGVVLMAAAGIIATLTSINSAMLSATREAFTLSRDGTWPRSFSRLSPWRTPFIAILMIGLISGLIAAIGLVEFLSFISSAGYLFVLFFGSLSLIMLRKRFPNIERPFKVPLYPLTAWMATAACVLIISFSNPRALVFLAGVLALFSIYYFVSRALKRKKTLNHNYLESRSSRILVPVANPKTAEGLMRISSIIVERAKDASICVFAGTSIFSNKKNGVNGSLLPLNNPQTNDLINKIARLARKSGAALYTKIQSTKDLAQSILDEIHIEGKVDLVLMGWPGKLNRASLAHNVVNEVLISAKTNVAVFQQKQLKQIKNILVPVGGGTHSRLAIQMAYEIAEMERARLHVLRTCLSTYNQEEIEDQKCILEEIVEDELGYIPRSLNINVVMADSLATGILKNMSTSRYDLLVIGASDEWASRRYLFGKVDDQIVEQAPCSVLMVRRYEPVIIHWFHRQIKKVAEKNNP
jgi:basic amino acid/polyamine antiporter, APA family